jgi:hypothetical protein
MAGGLRQALGFAYRDGVILHILAIVLPDTEVERELGDHHEYVPHAFSALGSIANEYAEDALALESLRGLLPDTDHEVVATAADGLHQQVADPGHRSHGIPEGGLDLGIEERQLLCLEAKLQVLPRGFSGFECSLESLQSIQDRRAFDRRVRRKSRRMAELG